MKVMKKLVNKNRIRKTRQKKGRNKRREKVERLQSKQRQKKGGRKGKGKEKKKDCEERCNLIFNNGLSQRPRLHCVTRNQVYSVHCVLNPILRCCGGRYQLILAKNFI
jgi:hypothetical protein